MDTRTFDRLAAEAARCPTRRATFRLLAGGLLAALLPARVARAQRPDRDGDGLYDDDESNVYGTDPDDPDTDGDSLNDGYEVYIGNDPLVRDFGGAGTDRDGDGLYDIDETSVYGTNPDVADTDGDGVDDGEEVYLGTDPRSRCNGLTDCGGICADLLADDSNCGACGVACQFYERCTNGACDNCGGSCIDFGGAPPTCTGGLTACGADCVDLGRDSWHCGACDNSCPIGSICDGGACVSNGYFCVTQGLTECDGRCVDIMSDPDHCGRCEDACYVDGARCVNGACVD